MAKRRRIKGASVAPASLPTGAILVGRLVAALGLPGGAVDGRLQGSSAHRLFRGERIEDKKIVDILAAAGDALVEFGLAPATRWKPGRGPTPARRAGLALHHMMARWDEATVALRGGTLRGVDRKVVVLAAARLLAVDLALRAAAWLALVGVELNEASTLRDPPQVATILADLVDRTKLSHDEIAERCRVARTTVDDWVHGARIVDDNLSNLVLLVADGPEADEVLARTRRDLTIAEILTQLRAALGAELADEVDDLWRGTLRLAIRFSRFMGRSRLLGEERFEPPGVVLAYGGCCEPAQFVLKDALKQEQEKRSAWLAVLEVGAAWTEYLVHAARIGRSAGCVVKAGFSQEAEHAAMLGMLARPRHHAPAVPEGWKVVRVVGNNETKASNRLVQVHDALDRGDVDEAVTHARRAVELTPLAWLAHFQLGVALAAACHVEEAITECAIAAELASSAANIELAKVEVGIVLTNAGRDEEARVRLEDLHASTAEASIHLLYNLGVVRMRCGRFAEALDAFMKVVAKDTHHPRALDCGAHCAFSVGERRMGIDYAKRANLLGQHETYNAWHAGMYNPTST